MASFLGGQEKADVASLAKQAGNVSFPFKTEDSYNFKQKCGMDKNKRVTWLDTRQIFLTTSIPVIPFLSHTSDFYYATLFIAFLYLSFLFFI